MIETEQSIVIDAPIGKIWAFANDIRGWARLMPGLQDCQILDADRSLWTLKIGAGALVRTVQVAVQVERWAGPEEVDFTYRLAGDPVQGSGTYRAAADGADRSRIGIAVQVQGTGPMAPMWEAIGRPLLPKFARGFAEQFKQQVELFADMGQAEPAATAAPQRGRFIRLVERLRRWFGRPAEAANDMEKPE
jgi:carbon monoxide dehydrogenase subunit G